jgi:hypothetical protein
MINETTQSISQVTESNMILFAVMEKYMQESSNIMANTAKEVKENKILTDNNLFTQNLIMKI